jgi:hypothetical protein
MRSSFVALLAPAIVLAGCSGKTTLDVGSNHAASTAPTIPVAHPPPYDAATVAAAKAACDAPHGPIDPATTASETKARLEGAWFACSSSQPEFYPPTSIELLADGHWYDLEPDANGGLTRSQGIDHEGTYSAGDPSFSADPTGLTGPYQAFSQFESGPRRMKLEVVTAGTELWFIYLGPSDAP